MIFTIYLLRIVVQNENHTPFWDPTKILDWNSSDWWREKWELHCCCFCSMEHWRSSTLEAFLATNRAPGSRWEITNSPRWTLVRLNLDKLHEVTEKYNEKFLYALLAQEKASITGEAYSEDYMELFLEFPEEMDKLPRLFLSEQLGKLGWDIYGGD